MTLCIFEKYLRETDPTSLYDDHGALRHGLLHVVRSGRRGDHPLVVCHLAGLQARHVFVRDVRVGHLLGAAAPWYQGQRYPDILKVRKFVHLYFS